MKTRTLLILAFTCGVAILLAGGIQLLRVSTQDESPDAVAVGEPARAADASVTLLGTRSDGGVLTATVRLGGVDDADGLDGFTLVAPGRVVLVDATASTCAGLTVEPQECDLAFDTASVEGTARQLLFRRGEDQLRWVLAG